LSEGVAIRPVDKSDSQSAKLPFLPPRGGHIDPTPAVGEHQGLRPQRTARVGDAKGLLLGALPARTLKPTEDHAPLLDPPEGAQNHRRSPTMMNIFAVRPCLHALRRERALPVWLRGPVLFVEFARLAAAALLM